jgi:hypothetical protein
MYIVELQYMFTIPKVILFLIQTSKRNKVLIYSFMKNISIILFDY